MRIAYITAGAGGTICGNCLRDNTLAAAMIALGEDVTLLPVYTPIRTDEKDVSEGSVYLGGVNIYLQQRSALFRKLPKALDRILDTPALLRWVSRFAVKTLPEDLGALTVATIQGAQGPLAKEIDRLIEHLGDLGPEIVHLTNSMLVGLAGPIKERLRIPVVCSLQGEDVYLDGLPEPYRTQAYDELRKQAEAVELFVAPCRNHAEALAGRVGRTARNIAVVYPGIRIDDLKPADRLPEDFTVGYLARIAPEKGLDLLANALPDGARLKAAGWVSPEHDVWVRGVQAAAGLEELEILRDVDRAQKIRFLQSIHALSVPTRYGASKGLYLLEAWAAGVPVVQPRIGAFPELVEATGGGLLVPPNSSLALKEALERLRNHPDEARELGAKGRKAVQENFTAADMARNTLNVYRKLL